MERKWYNPLTWNNKGALRFPKRYGKVFATLFGGVDIYDDNYDTYLVEGHQKNDVVFSITTHIADSVGKAKWYLRDKNTGKEIKNTHFDAMIRKSGPEKSFADINRDGVKQKLLTGNAFYVGEKGNGVNRDKFSHIYVIPSQNMQIRGSQKGIFGYYPNITTGFDGIIPASDVLHIKTTNPLFNNNDTTEWLYGQPPLRAAKESIKAYNDSKLAGNYYLQNKGAQKAVLLDENTDLGLEGETQMKSALRGTGQGVSNNANIPVLQGVKGVVDLGADPKKALVLEQRIQAAQEICNVFNYPSQLIGIKNATYQNAKEAKKFFWENCVVPQLEELADGFNRWLAPQYGPNVEFCFDISHIDAIQEDKLMRGAAITKFAGMITINEARQKAGMSILPWMKTPTNMEEFKEQLYVGFTQSVIQDTNENTNGQEQEGENQQDSESEDN